MKPRTFFVLASLSTVVASCSDVIADTETKYEIVKKSGDRSETCKYRRELVELYLANNMEDEYLAQKAASEKECQRDPISIEEVYGN